MSTTTSSINPLFTEDVDQTPEIGGNAAGAAGSSEGGVQLSSSALIAIIVVVSIVAVGGSKCHCFAMASCQRPSLT
ncbi:hypothetical protein OOU_Y34scaffold00683g8 [Pyricularia oryzae Y34]|uniref:Uncharacterized protein n=2 Tax=Pyricularia oryzae TaxID=318829 RepID=A0AA97PIH5_PYRO3|nr:hypothetical protein OOU_Y34scaffold00683g8 [Pyricularia oryzae Y34]